MAERKFAALAELRRRPEPPPTDEPPAPDQAESAPPPQGAPRPEPEPPAAPIPVPVVAAPPPAPAPAPPPIAAAVPAAIVPEVQKGRGRPPGKRSDPDWAPRTILMRSKTHRRVSIMLLERDGSPDLSELVDELLAEWISRQL